MEQNGRLNSWKEIANYLGRSTRTVQRWEEELGLPVYRVQGKIRDIVFAYTAEVDEWIRVRRDLLTDEEPENTDASGPKETGDTNGGIGDSSPAHEPEGRSAEHESPIGQGADEREEVPPASIEHSVTRQHTRWLAKFALIMVATAALFLTGVFSPRIASLIQVKGHPASYRVGEKTLTVVDASGRELWTYQFDSQLETQSYARQLLLGEHPDAQFHDLDGDGKMELLFKISSAEPTLQNLYCFNEDGKVRFVHKAGRAMRYDNEDFAPPYVVHDFFVTPNGDGTKSIWVAARHHLMFPSVTEKLDNKGQLLGDFWHQGHQQTMMAGAYQGRRAIFLGYVDNDGKRASFAAIDYEHPTGFSRSERDAYMCKTCPEGSPLAYLVFPRMDVSQATDSRPGVWQIRPATNGEVTLIVSQSRFFPGPGTPLEAPVFYRLSNDFKLLSAETGDSYVSAHHRLESEGRLNHRYTRAEDRDLFPVLRWDEKRFVTIRGPENTSASARLAAPR